MEVKVQKSRKMNFQVRKNMAAELGGGGGGVLKRATGTDRPVIESVADYSHMMNAGLSR